MKKLIHKCNLNTILPPVLGLSALLMPGFAQAATTTYILSNHPSSGDSPLNNGPVDQFGLRLDGLESGAHDQNYIFDFEHADSAMYLQYDDIAHTIHIYGTSHGGQDNDSGATCVNFPALCVDSDNNGLIDDTEAVWSIDFTYNMDMGLDLPDEGGFADVSSTNQNGDNTGTISSIFGSYELSDHFSSNHGLSFIFGDDSDVSQGTDVLTGWGWLDYCDLTSCTLTSRLYTNDWLFEATVVPVPAAVWLFASGLLGLVAVSRRRKV